MLNRHMASAGKYCITLNLPGGAYWQNEALTISLEWKPDCTIGQLLFTRTKIVIRHSAMQRKLCDLTLVSGQNTNISLFQQWEHNNTHLNKREQKIFFPNAACTQIKCMLKLEVTPLFYCWCMHTHMPRHSQHTPTRTRTRTHTHTHTHTHS